MHFQASDNKEHNDTFIPSIIQVHAGDFISFLQIPLSSVSPPRPLLHVLPPRRPQYLEGMLR